MATVADVCIRAVAEPMRAILGQPFVIEIIIGATGDIGLRSAVAAGADDYTLVQASAANTANYAARPKIAFDLADELRPIGKCGVSAFTLAVSPSLGVRVTEEYIDDAQAQPGQAGLREHRPRLESARCGGDVRLAHQARHDVEKLCSRGAAEKGCGCHGR